jgi:hypothetical protein
MMTVHRAKEPLMQKLITTLVLSLLTLPSWSQSPTTASKASQAKSKAATAKAPSKSKALQAAPVEPDTPMGPDELAIAERVHKGQLPCELGATVRLEADASQPGYFYLHGKGFRYRMHPVVTTTGCMR